MNRPTLAKICSFLALICLFLNYYLFVILFYPLSQRAVTEQVLCSMLGTALCFFLGPLFLPLPNKSKKPLWGIVFIAVIIVPNIIVRSLGMELWASSILIRALMSLFSGMLNPLCVGLFFLMRLDSQSEKNHTGKTGSLLFALALSCGILTRHIIIYLMHLSSKAL